MVGGRIQSAFGTDFSHMKHTLPIGIVAAALLVGSAAVGVAASTGMTRHHVSALDEAASSARTEVDEVGTANQAGEQGQQGESAQANQTGDQGQKGELGEANQTGDQGQKGESGQANQSGS